MIPKKIHYCWIGGNPLPELAQKCIESWKKFCPDYEIIEWNETNYDFGINQYMKDAYEAKKWGFVPDYARLDIIYKYGGIYLDTDVEIIKPIDDLLQYHAFMGMEKPGVVNLGQGFGAEPNNELMKEMRDYYDHISFINSNGSFNTIASPIYQTEIIKKHCDINENKKYVLNDAIIFPCEYFCPISLYTGKTEITSNTYSIHHFMASWQTPLDSFIMNLSKKFDKSRKAGFVCERMITFPFRAYRKYKQMGLKGTINFAKRKMWRRK